MAQVFEPLPPIGEFLCPGHLPGQGLGAVCFGGGSQPKNETPSALALSFISLSLSLSLPFT